MEYSPFSFAVHTLWSGWSDAGSILKSCCRTKSLTNSSNKGKVRTWSKSGNPSIIYASLSHCILSSPCANRDRKSADSVSSRTQLDVQKHAVAYEAAVQFDNHSCIEESNISNALKEGACQSKGGLVQPIQTTATISVELTRSIQGPVCQGRPFLIADTLLSKAPCIYPWRVPDPPPKGNISVAYPIL